MKIENCIEPLEVLSIADVQVDDVVAFRCFNLEKDPIILRKGERGHYCKDGSGFNCPP